MIRPRTAAPPPAVEYFLDCAAQAGELDAGTGMTLRLYGDDAVLVPLLGTPVNVRRARLQDRLQLNLSLAVIADGILEKLTPHRRGGLIRLGLLCAVDEMMMNAETLSNWAIEDSTEGGCLLPFRRRARSRDGVPFKRLGRRLRSPKFIRRYVKSHVHEIEHAGTLMQLCIRRAQRWGTANDPAIRLDLATQAGHRAKRNIFRDRRVERADRKMVLRSLRTAISTVGEETVQAFLRGEEVRLIGAESMLAIRKRGLLTDRGHGCLSIGLASRDGTMLGDLCTYVEDTPTLDQLSAFALWMKSGEDRSVLEKANVTSISEAGRAHPLVKVAKNRAINLDNVDRARLLADLIEAVGPEDANRIAEIISCERRPHIPQITHAQRLERNSAYWEETKGHWIEAMVAQMVGYANLPIFKAAEVL